MTDYYDEDGTPVDLTDYDQFKAMAKQIGRPIEMLIAMSPSNDPFALAAARVELAKWVAETWHNVGVTGAVHLRRVHYILVSRANIPWLKGGVYENTAYHWKNLADGVRDARYLGLIPVDDFGDKRNAAVIHLVDSAEEADLDVFRDDFDEIIGDMPSGPELRLTPPKINQRYHLEIWAEKTTQNDILLPLAERYGINLITGAGDLSLTQCMNFIDRAKQSDRPARILYISDFDLSGENMPVAVARKVEFAMYKEDLDLDVQVRSIALTKEQCERFSLPRVPMKPPKERQERKHELWTERHGEGATELDALEALHPGSLRRIVYDEIRRYYDLQLDDKIDKAASELDFLVDEANETVQDNFGESLASLRASWDEITAKIDEWKALAESTFQGMDAELHDLSPDIGSVDWPEPDEGIEDDDPLYCSSRDYVEQIERYKRHQGKPIDGISRGGRQRRDGKRKEKVAA